MRVAIRSRLGRSVLTVLGVLYFAAATAVLVYYIRTNWGSNTIKDYVLQLGLICSALGGIYFVLIGTDSFRAWRSGARSRPTTEHRKAVSAA